MLNKKVNKLIKVMVSAALTAVLSISQPSITNAASGYNGDYYGFDLDFNEAQKGDIADGWSNGDMFATCTWRSQNVSFNDGKMKLSITNDPYGKTQYAGGEYRSKEYFGYGRYDVRMKPIKNDGVVSSFFTYTGPSDGTRWDEIDIEFLGKDTTKVQFKYYTNGVGNHEYLYDLGFDASIDFHEYSFIWEKDKITWCVDGKAVYTATKDIPCTPGKIMMNAWPGVNVDTWLNKFNGKTGLVAEYDWASYTNISKYNSTLNKAPDTNPHQGNASTETYSGLVSGKTYFINSKFNSKCLDVAYCSKDAGANIQQWDYLTQSNQQWVLEKQSNGLYIIKNLNSGKVIDVSWASKEDCANIQQWDFNNGYQQLWKIEPVGNAYKIINANNGKALEIYAFSNQNSGNIQQYTYNGGDNQLWYFTKLN